MTVITGANHVLPYNCHTSYLHFDDNASSNYPRQYDHLRYVTNTDVSLHPCTRVGSPVAPCSSVSGLEIYDRNAKVSAEIRWQIPLIQPVFVPIILLFFSSFFLVCYTDAFARYRVLTQNLPRLARYGSSRKRAHGLVKLSSLQGRCYRSFLAAPFKLPCIESEDLTVKIPTGNREFRRRF